MTIKALYPNVRPSLDLNFARTRALDPRITFTRASAATHVGPDGLIKIATNNTSRFDHNPSTGESLGFLIEDGRTNECTYSNDFTARSGHWGSHGVGTALDVTLNAGISPDGTNNAALLTAPDASGGYYRNNTAQIGTAVKTFSIFLKAGTTTSVGLRIFSGQAPNGCSVAFNLANGTYTLFSPSISVASMVAFPNNWYRCSFARTDGNDKQPCNFEGIAQGNFYAYGAQSESGAFSTSYIPTGSSTVTRAGEVASIQGSNFTNWFNASAGTFLCEWKSGFPANERILNFGAGSVATIISNEGVIGSGTYFSPLQIFPNSISGNGIKIAATTSISESAGAYNGNAVVSTGACSYYASASSLNFCPSDSGVRVNWYKKVTYWPSRLSNIQLQALTQ